jgi:hypothetical protein
MPQTGSSTAFEAGAAGGCTPDVCCCSAIQVLPFSNFDYIRLFRDSLRIQFQTPFSQELKMTLLDVVFKYGTPPGEKEMLALNNAREVYGVRKIKFDEQERTLRVEYDATRLNDGEIAAILRRAGIDLREKVQLV